MHYKLYVRNIRKPARTHVYVLRTHSPTPTLTPILAHQMFILMSLIKRYIARLQ